MCARNRSNRSVAFNSEQNRWHRSDTQTLTRVDRFVAAQSNAISNGTIAPKRSAAVPCLPAGAGGQVWLRWARVCSLQFSAKAARGASARFEPLVGAGRTGSSGRRLTTIVFVASASASKSDGRRVEMKCPALHSVPSRSASVRLFVPLYRVAWHFIQNHIPACAESRTIIQSPRDWCGCAIRANSNGTH